MSSITTGGRSAPAWHGMWNRQLTAYPSTARRVLYLGSTVLATITLYYELYIQGAVSTKIISHYGFSFTEFVFVLVIGNALGAFASLGAGLADRWGRANLVVGGLLLTALLTLFALPNASSRAEYTVFFALVAIVEGVALVATPALIRDFSPQLGRGSAMAFWTMGPVLGSLVVTEVSSHTLAAHPAWQYQLRLCGIVGLVVWAITFVVLRELPPRLRDQLMVSLRERALVEARASGIDPDRLRAGHWRQMLSPRITGPALAISLFLMGYYIAVAFTVVYFATVFGYSPARANDLGNWYWIADAIALAVIGLLSDRVLVRKPFMVLGTVISLVGLGKFAISATHPGTSYGSFVFDFILIGAGAACAYVAWMAAFTESVERINPAATATGLAVWGWILRIVVTVSYALLTAVVPATNTLVNQGTKVSAIVAQYPTQVKVLNTVDKTTLTTLATQPTNAAAQVRALSELSGLPAATVATVVTASTADRAQLATLAVIDKGTLATLATDPTNPAADTKAVGEIVAGLHVTPAAAIGQLKAAAAVPAATLGLLSQDGPRVQAAATRLKSLSAMPPAATAYLAKYGTKVSQAQHKNPGQWQTWWWICFAAQIVFLPFVFLLSGRWSPRRAREDERQHAQRVEQELSALRT